MEEGIAEVLILWQSIEKHKTAEGAEVRREFS
jgi:hypothetical protein